MKDNRGIINSLISSGQVLDVTDNPREINFKNRVGLKINYLTINSLYKVLKFKNNGRHKAYWECTCICGNVVIKNTDVLNNNKGNFSCGCLRDALNKKRLTKVHDRKEQSYRRIMYSYRGHAKIRGLVFELTYPQFKAVMILPCYFCGIESSAYIRNRDSGDIFYYNGLDRVDNRVGYTVNNCIPCCRRCNTAKNSITPDMVKKLVTLLKERGLYDE